MSANETEEPVGLAAVLYGAQQVINADGEAATFSAAADFAVSIIETLSKGEDVPPEVAAAWARVRDFLCATEEAAPPALDSQLSFLN